MRFAHMADIHLGFQRAENEYLRDVERRTFEGIMDRCINDKMDFVVISGDLFHVNIPEMRVQKIAMRKFREVHQAGIPIYVVYGSHDFSPISNSAIDLLEAAGYITKVTIPSDGDGPIRLKFLTDPKTGAKLVGLSGLKVGRDKEYYEMLDREYLESEPGFKIFLFHGAISEMIRGEAGDDNMPISLLPRGFQYYAGGHLHSFRRESFPGYHMVVYPGTPFAGYHSDMEESARGIVRGFVMVEFDDSGVKGAELVEVSPCEYHTITVDAESRRAEDVDAEIRAEAASGDVDGKVVILQVSGELGAGRAADIDIAGIRRVLNERGARSVLVKIRGLTSREYKIRGESGDTRDVIESRTFQENIGQIRTKRESLAGSRGVKLAQTLLGTLRHPKPENEKTSDYKQRMSRDAMARMGLEE